MFDLCCIARDEPVAALSGLSQEGRYRYWRGRSGRRYLHTVHALADWPGHSRANLIFVRRRAGADGEVLAVAWLGRTSPDGRARELFARMAAAGASEVHVHLLAGSDAARRAVAGDIRAALGRTDTPAEPAEA